MPAQVRRPPGEDAGKSTAQQPLPESRIRTSATTPASHGSCAGRQPGRVDRLAIRLLQSTAIAA